MYVNCVVVIILQYICRSNHHLCIPKTDKMFYVDYILVKKTHNVHFITKPINKKKKNSGIFDHI